MPNRELFDSYSGELALRNRSPRGRHEAKRVLGLFESFLDDYHPTVELATAFLARYQDRKSTTLARYHAIINGFMSWMGEPLSSKIKVPQPLPQYVRDEEVEKLREAIRGTRTGTAVERNLIMVDLLGDTGLRRAEAANLRVGDIDLDGEVLMVKSGKGGKDRMVELTPSLVEKLEAYLAGRDKGEKVLGGLTPSAISDIIRRNARKAGVDLHTHSLRDYFATRLIDRGVDIETIRRLMGHTNLNTTQRYLGRSDEHRREAIRRLDGPSINARQSKRTVAVVDGADQTLRVGQTQKHHGDMLDIIGRWRDELGLLLRWSPARELGGQGIHRGGDEQHPVNWEISADGEVFLHCPFEDEDDIHAVLRRSYLYSHLESGNLFWLQQDPDIGMPAWRAIGGQELSRRCDLLNTIDRSCRRLSEKHPAQRPDGPGPTPLFSETIWTMVLDGMGQGFDYETGDEPENGLHSIRYGSWAIAKVTTRKECQKYIRWHKDLVRQYQDDDLVWEVGELRKEREELAKGMLEELAKIVVGGHLPGACSGCPA